MIIVLGGAETVWDDLASARDIVGDMAHDIGGVNEAARDYEGHLSLMCSLHSEKIGKWQRQRKNAGHNDNYVTISNKQHADARIDYTFREVLPGSSGLYICTTAILFMDYEKVICCGMPMDERPHYHTGGAWNDARHYTKWWMEAASQPETAGRIKSMSGYSREVLGEPTTDWLKS